MTRKLTAHVYIDGSWYRPGEVPPSDVAERITNPKVWDGDAPKVEATKAPAREDVKQPPRKGPGSGGPAWIEHAERLGVTQKFDSKDALISHLEEQGLIDKE
jgi:hypothetical protein